MRLVNIQFVECGAVLARPVINPAGRILLQSGVQLTELYIERLLRLGLDVLFIEDDRLSDVDINTAISARTREVAYKTVCEVSQRALNNEVNSFKIPRVESTVKMMINDLLYSHDILSNLSEIRGYDDYTFHHSVNTTILALILGLAMGYQEAKLLELGMGVLMHDVGKVKIPEEILNKTTPLTAEEFVEIKRHPISGYELLRQNRDLSLLSAHVAYQHHERWDGSGYPRGLKGPEIHEHARIAAVADVYEALTSKRIYRDPVKAHEAYEYMVAHAGSQFDPHALHMFAIHIAVYPTGSGVRLSNGQRGNVFKQNPSFPSRPYVRVFYENEIPLSSPVDYNLAEHPSLIIADLDNR